MKFRKIISIILSALMIASAVPFAFVSAAEGTPANPNVAFVADSAADGGDGSLAKPFNALYAAFEKLAKSGGVVVVIGVCSLFEGLGEIMPVTEKHITVTSYYDGVDYRAKKYASEEVGARIDFLIGPTTSFALNGDVTFDYINFSIGSTTKNAIITANFNDLTITENCATLFEEIDGTVWYDGSFYLDNNARSYAPIILSGENVQPGGKTVVCDQEINIFGGIWNSIRIGDRDNASRNTYDGKVTLNIDGANTRFVQYTGAHKTNNLSVMGNYQVSTTKNFVATVNIKNGIFDGQINGFGYPGGVTPEPQLNEGTININITGGKFNRSFGGEDGVGNIIYMAQVPNGFTTSKGYISELGETAVVNLYIDPTNITYGENDGLIVYGEEGVKCNLTVASDKGITAEGVEMKISAPTTTEAPVVTTAAPVVTEPTVVTTAAPTQAEPTPPTGDATIVLFASALVALAAVVVISKRRVRN